MKKDSPASPTSPAETGQGTGLDPLVALLLPLALAIGACSAIVHVRYPLLDPWARNVNLLAGIANMVLSPVLLGILSVFGWRRQGRRVALAATPLALLLAGGFLLNGALSPPDERVLAGQVKGKSATTAKFGTSFFLRVAYADPSGVERVYDQRVYRPVYDIATEGAPATLRVRRGPLGFSWVAGYDAPGKDTPGGGGGAPPPH